ncbi:unnamed protein product, partial [Mesorhabditis belari]|uniref:Uncharacterized protein n=1 Tax=Mesorhabditis belari TaxID=2138241 RepID=A0AAF3FC93_9BILA
MGDTIQRKMTPVKRDKQLLQEFDHQVREIRSQLTEQLKALGERTETQIHVLSELEDYFRRRGELEIEQSKQLDKLAKGILQKHKADKTRRENWQQHASSYVWQQLVDATKEEAKERLKMGEIFAKELTSSIAQRCDDLARISKRCREIGLLSHGEITRVLTELHTSMKTYQICFAEASAVEKKLHCAEDEYKKFEEANRGKPIGRKFKTLQKCLERRQTKWELVRIKCTKARNEYLLCIKAANAALNRFFGQDLSYLVDCMDLGMEFWMRHLIDQVIEARKKLTQKEMEALGELGTVKSSLDSKADKQRFFEANNSTFMLPKQFEFKAQFGDLSSTVSAERSLAGELAQRQRQITKRLDALRFESDEVWKSLEAAERQLFALYRDEVQDANKWRNDLLVTYQYYLKKFEYFLLNGNLVERLEARNFAIGESLNERGINVESRNGSEGPSIDGDKLGRKRIKRIGLHPDRPRPKLFGGSLEEYVEASGESIPLVVSSSISFLARYALRHQGLFRISGSQSEINRFKEIFECGEDPLCDLRDASEANSVAGVLKLYLRELREPLFPMYLFEQFTDCAKAENATEFVAKSRRLLVSLPPCSLVLLRVLFGFLAHLCEFADENMMEPHNLAICFGPTLLPIPEGKDQVFYHNFVNEFVRGLIVHNEKVFPSEQEMAGPVYDKYAFELHNMNYVDDMEGDDGLTSGDEEVLLGIGVTDGMAETSFKQMEIENEEEFTPRISLISRQSEATRGPSHASIEPSENTSLRDLAFRDVFQELSLALKDGNVAAPVHGIHETPIDSSPFPVTSNRSSTRSNMDFRVDDLSPRPNSSVPMTSVAVLSRPPVVSLRDQLSHAAPSHPHKIYPTEFDAITRTSIKLQKLSMLNNASNNSDEKDDSFEKLSNNGNGNGNRIDSSSTGMPFRFEQPDIVRELGPREIASVTKEFSAKKFEPSHRALNSESPPFAELERAIQAAERL